jgi:hypothetical protein
VPDLPAGSERTQKGTERSMSVTVTIRNNQSTIVVPGADSWQIDDKGYLELWSRTPSAVVATFAPGWEAVIDDDTNGATSS